MDMVILLLLAAATAAAAPVAFPELEPLEAAARLAAMPEPLPLENLIAASLAFSGAEGERLERLSAELRTVMDSFSPGKEEMRSTRQLGEEVLRFLHERFLSTYMESQTRMDVLLERGTYNCVSSAVLYLIVGRSAGLTMGAVRTSDHAFCTVWDGNTEIDVETTSVLGFDPGTKREFRDSFGRVTGYAYVPQNRAKDRQGIGEKDLLGLILVNRTMDLAGQGRLQDALRAAVSARILSPSVESTETLMRTLFSYCLWLGNRDEMDRGLDLLDAVERRFGTSDALIQQRRTLSNNRILSLLDAGDWPTADAAIRKALEKGSIEEAQAREFRIYAVLKHAEKASQREEFLSAANIVLEGIVGIGEDPALVWNYENYLHHFFSRLYNAGRYAEARTAIEGGLRRFPHSSVFLHDQELIGKALQP